MSKFDLSRRTLLRGAGTLMALPVLEAMMPGLAKAQAASKPRRIGAFFVPCGIHMAGWNLDYQGPLTRLSPILASLEKVKSKVLVLSGLDNQPGFPDGFGDHASGTSSFLTAAHAFKTAAANIRVGTSMDQVAAQHLKQFTPRLPSLELGVDGGGGTGDCDSGYSCAYIRNISWSSPTTPMPKEVNPQAVFDRLFGALDPNATAAAIASRRRLKQSVLDAVKADATGLKGKLGKTDQRKVDEYFESVRALEVKVNAEAGRACTPPSRPGGFIDIRDRTTQMLDLIALAFQCDLTRVVTFMLQNGLSGYPFTFLGLQGGHHGYSHHQRAPGNLDALQRINTWEVQQFAALLEKLDAIQEPDGTVLDNSLIVFGSEIEDGDSHSHNNMPMLLAGRGGGAVTSGRHVGFGVTPVANLYVTMLQAVGVQTTAFGNSNGALPLR